MRAKLLLLVLCALAIGDVLAACRDDKPAAPAPAPSTPSAPPVPTELPEAPERAESQATAPIKIAFIYGGVIADAGWTHSHEQGRKAIELEYGAKVDTSFIEKVSDDATAERVMRQLVHQGNKLIYDTTYTHAEALRSVAASAPDVTFEHASGHEVGSNIRSYDARFYEGVYLAGVIAGRVTKTRKVGVVASLPGPDIIRLVNAFALGARRTKPEVTVKIAWTLKWYDPAAEGDAALELVSKGVDVLFHTTDNSGVLQAAEKSGAFSFGLFTDMSRFAPRAHLASIVANWGVYYKKSVADVLAGAWKPGIQWYGFRSGVIELVSVSKSIPVAVREEVDQIKASLVDGRYHPFSGPIVDQSGRTRVKAGTTLDDEQLRQFDYLVKGVEGKLPSL